MTTTDIAPRIEDRARALREAQEEQEQERLRAVAAAEIATEAAEAEHRQRLEQFAATMPGRIDATSVDKAEQAMARALTAYVAACRQRTDVIVEAYEFVATEGGCYVNPGTTTVTISGQSYRPPDPQRGIYDALLAAVGAHFPRTVIRVDWRYLGRAAAGTTRRTPFRCGPRQVGQGVLPLARRSHRRYHGRPWWWCRGGTAAPSGGILEWRTPWTGRRGRAHTSGPAGRAPDWLCGGRSSPGPSP